jgi:hypothetical protein
MFINTGLLSFEGSPFSIEGGEKDDVFGLVCRNNEKDI